MLRKYFICQQIFNSSPSILNTWFIMLINFQPRNSHTSPIFDQNFILKFQDKICLENILFVSKSLNDSSPSIFKTWFRFYSHHYEIFPQYETSSSTQGKGLSTNNFRHAQQILILSLFFTDKIKMNRILTKIKWKIQTLFIDCRQITSITLNKFCPLRTPPRFLTEKIKMNRILTKIKWKTLYIVFEVLKELLIIIWMQLLDLLLLVVYVRF